MTQHPQHTLTDAVRAYLRINDRAWMEDISKASRGDGTYDPLVIERILQKAQNRIYTEINTTPPDDPLEQAMRETAIERGFSTEQPAGEEGSK